MGDRRMSRLGKGGQVEVLVVLLKEKTKRRKGGGDDGVVMANRRAGRRLSRYLGLALVGCVAALASLGGWAPEAAGLRQVGPPYWLD